MNEATLSSKNQVVIPKEARDVLCVKPGDKLLFVIRNGFVLVLAKPQKHSKALRGLGKRVYPAGYLKKEHRSWE